MKPEHPHEACTTQPATVNKLDYPDFFRWYSSTRTHDLPEARWDY
jgi:hypothetical protein